MSCSGRERRKGEGGEENPAGRERETSERQFETNESRKTCFVQTHGGRADPPSPPQLSNLPPRPTPLPKDSQERRLSPVQEQEEQLDRFQTQPYQFLLASCLSSLFHGSPSTTFFPFPFFVAAVPPTAAALLFFSLVELEALAPTSSFVARLNVNLRISGFTSNPSPPPSPTSSSRCSSFTPFPFDLLDLGFAVELEAPSPFPCRRTRPDRWRKAVICESVVPFTMSSSLELPGERKGWKTYLSSDSLEICLVLEVQRTWERETKGGKGRCHPVSPWLSPPLPLSFVLNYKGLTFTRIPQALDIQPLAGLVDEAKGENQSESEEIYLGRGKEERRPSPLRPSFLES